MTVGKGLEVVIDYSFYVPEVMGAATPQSAGCCPYGILPDNETDYMVPPTVFGIGVQKGGTTTLYEHFKVHPQMHETKKELHYLDDAKGEMYQEYLKKWEWNREGPKALVETETGVREEFVAPKIGALFEISPSYMFVPFAACKAKVIAPNGKFIVFLRDPVDRAHSGFSYAAVKYWNKHQSGTEWMRRSFLDIMAQGLLEIESEAACDFQTGKGVNSYNDCVGCMLRRKDLRSACEGRQFVALKDAKGSFECTFVGKEHILRGLYGPQLAWWFTFFHPSQFKIINSVDFFKDPMQVMKDIGHFLDLKPAYAQWMMQRSKKKANVGHYQQENETMVAHAKAILAEFYRRPNLELYRLLDETGHHNFKPFENYFEEDELLDCTDSNITHSGLCGDPRFLHTPDSEVPLIDDRLPETIQQALASYRPKNSIKSESTDTSETETPIDASLFDASPPSAAADPAEAPTAPESPDVAFALESPIASPNDPGTTIKVMFQPNSVVVQRDFQSGLIRVDRFVHILFGGILTMLFICVLFYRRRRRTH